MWVVKVSLPISQTTQCLLFLRKRYFGTMFEISVLNVQCTKSFGKMHTTTSGRKKCKEDILFKKI